MWKTLYTGFCIVLIGDKKMTITQNEIQIQTEYKKKIIEEIRDYLQVLGVNSKEVREPLLNRIGIRIENCDISKFSVFEINNFSIEIEVKVKGRTVLTIYQNESYVYQNKRYIQLQIGGKRLNVFEPVIRFSSKSLEIYI